MEKNLSYYENLLPAVIHVQIHQEDDGTFWAKITDYDGCYTQGNTFGDLLVMVSDAVFTVLEIPEELRVFLPHYLPKKLVEELKRHELQKQFNEFIAEQIKGKQELQFTK